MLYLAWAAEAKLHVRPWPCVPRMQQGQGHKDCGPGPNDLGQGRNLCGPGQVAFAALAMSGCRICGPGHTWPGAISSGSVPHNTIGPLSPSSRAGKKENPKTRLGKNNSSGTYQEVAREGSMLISQIS